ncbi:ATP-dependent helicase [Helicobacter turcicus]|uniref:DNA 3'-5' helicase n=1 Tax=Helicobacter turcicus TaxID=2867412 RepID=A0ABS7JMN5_9HELI|nr:UvrD-helicase domain-containing protein [Helicobacter turcicus]MBX7490664.1 UvrD-helicase domain-containing protein [Helicobacter turcicus]MBX7545428.1 UvrD-helicase domain-containing protein [Helicobacter turcicus]
MQDFLDDLNPSQREAATSIDGALLILAGAGSGKTKTITARLAYLIDVVGIPPSNTLTLTFTNKAASQMQKRALSMIKNTSIHPPLLCTFHKFGLLFLKFYITHLGRKANFILADSEDTKRIVKELNSDLAPLPLVLSEISRYKNAQMTSSEALKNAHNDTYKHIAKVYGRYGEFLLQKNMVDFDDLLLLPLEIMQQNPQVAKEVSEKYQYIMVDEYQDTNHLQYLLLKCLCSTHQNLCVVGDDDQSIYSWRGANIQNILQFSEHFKGAKVIKLQENYRSTHTILQAANALITKNKERLGKTLISTLGKGKNIEILHAGDEQEEVQKIAKEIRKLLDSGVNPKDIAILFRLNALSRSLEEGFNRARIPYVLVGAIRFYERSEIKDVLSYFRVLVNLEDDFSLARIINKPKRGIGKTTLDKILQLAQAHKTSVYRLFIADSIQEGLQETLKSAIGKKAYDAIEEFFATMLSLQESLRQSSLSFIDTFEQKIGLCEALSKSHDEIDRVSNIEEFYGVYREYIKQNPLMELEDFLNDLALRSDQEDIEMRKESRGIVGVSCMSVHSSKGLEFDYVFVIGLEEGFFPLVREDSNIEEERRLGYVAFTRAKKELFLSYADSRFYRGNRASLAPSRFLSESGVCGTHFKEEAKRDSNTGSFKRGDCVMHKIFGAGRILEVSQSGKELKLKINFGGLEREILGSYVSKV